MSSPPRRSTATTRTVPVLAPGLGRTADRAAVGLCPRRPAVLRPRRRRRPPISTVPTAAASTRRPIWRSFTGFLQADGYAGFEALYESGPDQAWPDHRSRLLGALPPEVLRRVGSDEIAGRQGGARPDRRDSTPSRTRPGSPLPPSGWHIARETAPLLDAFFAWAGATVVKLSARSELAEAFRYTIKRREALTRFVTDGRLEADNNIAENAMRGIALGRNYPHLRVMCSSPRRHRVRRSAGLHVCH